MRPESDIIFAVGYKGGMVEEYFGDGSRFGIRARYAYEEELLGTAGAIKNAGKYVTDEQFFVLNGDTFYQMDFGDLSRIQQEKNLEMALVLRGVPDISRYGAARLTDGLLTAFNEKNGNTGAGTINGGVYLMILPYYLSHIVHLSDILRCIVHRIRSLYHQDPYRMQFRYKS